MKKEKIFWGLFLIIAGMFLIISKLGYLEGINSFSILATMFFVILIIKSIIKVNFYGILFPLAFIAIIYDDQLGITSITPWTVLLAALLGSIGLSLIFGKKTFWISSGCCGHKYSKIDIEDDGHIKLDTNFGGTSKYIKTDIFEEGFFECNFGTQKIYFDKAEMKNESATINIEVNFSGVELYIPKTWRVVNNAKVIFGGITEKNRCNEITTNTLIINGEVNFSGVNIYYI